ncbi:MAG: glycosyltransferase family 2 protein [Pseudomonadota bacterium]
MELLSILAGLHTGVAAVLALLAFWLLLEVVRAQPAVSRTDDKEPGPIAVVIPAHNEGTGVAATVADVLAQLRSHDRLIVVADNCSDNTADVARDAGAEVIERTDAERRGKGFALQFALDHLRTDPPSSVVFTDADCFHTDGLIKAVARQAEVNGKPVQPLYIMRAGPDAPAKRAVAAFAWLLINDVRMRGLWSLAKTTRLTGAGAAFPWAIAEGLALGSGEIVEDLALTITLARAGTPVLLNTDHTVFSDFPETENAITVQRARWEHGSLRMIGTQSMSLAMSAFGSGGWPALALALNVAIPPISVFAAILIANALVASLFAVFGWMTPLLLALFAGAAAASALVLAWSRYGQETLPPSKLSALAAFAASKFGVYGQKARASSTQWTRTPREHEGDHTPKGSA